MKICIVTVYNSYNFGSYLQAKNLYDYLLEDGHDVFFYNGKSRNLFRGCLRKIKRNTLKSKNISKIFKGLLFELKEYRLLKKAWKSLPVLNNKYGFDCVIVGSDEIWNISRQECQNDDFWANEFDCPKIAYAPSINNANKSNFENSKYIKYLNNFTNISVRDDYSKKILSQFCNKKIDVVVDPTFLNKISNQKEYINDDYIAIYLFYGSLSTNEINEIIQFAKKKKLKLISLGQYISWCDKSIHSYNGMPFYAYKNAKYVITNTFHGTAFAINYRKQFIAYTKGKNKLVNLLEKFELLDRSINGNSLEDLFNKKIDYRKTNDIIDKNVNDSKSFLSDSIWGVENENNRK